MKKKLLLNKSTWNDLNEHLSYLLFFLIWYEFLFVLSIVFIVRLDSFSNQIKKKMPIGAFQRIFDFGSKKDDTKNVSSSDAIKRLSDVEEMLNKKQQHLESQIEEEKKTAIKSKNIE